jgi:ankyrin repeat protein
MYNLIDVVALLLDHGANVEYTTSLGNSPLIYACEKGHTEIVRLLLDHGADHRRVIRKIKEETTPLFSALINGRVDAARVLLARGAFEYDKKDFWITRYVIHHRDCSTELKDLFASYFVNYWQLRARLRVIGKASEPQRQVLGDKYLANHLGTFVFGEGVKVETGDS